MIINGRRPVHVPPSLLPAASLLGFFLLLTPVSVPANPDVYSVLPEDTRVLQFGLGDLDGSEGEELAVLFTTGEETRLTLFKGEAGHWVLWWQDGGLLPGEDGILPRSLEIADTNGDGRDEILTYALTEGGGALRARILSLRDPGEEDPVFQVILEDRTSPPGYPLLGREEARPSVTFLKMASGEGESGYRRVYCWDGEKFERCLEEEWK